MPAPTRRTFLAQSLAASGALAVARAANQPTSYRCAAFSADVTVPAGHGMMGGAWLSKSVADPLFAKGVVLTGGEKPVVIVSVDWCEIRNAAFDRWRDALAEAAGTDRQHVLVSSTHVHDAPVADLEAERILKEHQCAGTVCDVEFHETAVQRVAKALREALKSAAPVSQIGLGQARVEKVASNRRYQLPDGKVSYGRGSATRDVIASEAGEGTIDPMLKTLSFWSGNTPLAAVSNYATHPMSYYGDGRVTSDFAGLARKRRQAEEPGCRHIYFTGCSGNVSAGKYNDGSKEARPQLTDRLHAGIVASEASLLDPPGRRQATHHPLVGPLQRHRPAPPPGRELHRIPAPRPAVPPGTVRLHRRLRRWRTMVHPDRRGIPQRRLRSQRRLLRTHRRRRHDRRHPGTAESLTPPEPRTPNPNPRHSIPAP